MTLLKNAVSGALIGAVSGPLASGLLTFVLISLIGWGQGLVQQWSEAQFGEILPFALTLAVVVAPLGASVGAIVGVLVAGLPNFFHSRLNALSFGGLVGSVAGLFVLPGLFAGRSEEWASALVTVLVLAAVGVGVAFLVKRLVK